MSSGISPTWLANAFASIKNSMNQAGMLGTLQDMANGSLSSFSNQIQASANTFATISQNRVSGSTSLIAQIAAQNLQEQNQKELQKAFDALNSTQQMVQTTNVLDQFIYFENGSNLDTENNILTMSDGTKIDTVTGAKYVDPSTIVQMPNGGYLDTSTNILTMPDGTQIDTVTGLLVSQLSTA